jgi:RNA polymerase sigma factor (sigma-70 family)
MNTQIKTVLLPDSSRLDDNVIVSRIINGEKELFEIILRRYNQKLYRVIRSYLRAPEDIQDAMQDTYLKAFDKLQQFHGDSAFSTWLIRIGINEALQRIKKSKVAEFQGTHESIDKKTSQLPADKQMNPEHSAIMLETKKLLESAIDELPEKYRAIYVMREIEDMNNAEIALCLGLTESNVKVRHHRSKNLMKEALLNLSADNEIFEFGNARCNAMVTIVMSDLNR